MNRTMSRESTFQLFALLIVVILVHAVYVTVIWPNAEAIMSQQLATMRADPNYIAPNNMYVTLREYEPETCIILSLWCIGIIGYKWRIVIGERRLLGQQLLPLAEGVRILPEDAREYARQLQALPESERELLLPRALRHALQRFGATRSLPDVASSTHMMVTSEAERMDSELGIVRFIVWAIPAIGFVGTVRGIGMALRMAHRAVEGDVTSVTQFLGSAFNSTLIALMTCITLMFFVHQLQLVQERLAYEAEGYCDEHLISHLYTS